MIRRLKKDVLEELPAKLRGNVEVEITPKTRAAYNRAMKNADTPLTQITAGRHALGLAKVAPAVDLANEYADQDKPLLLFAHHKDVMDGLCEGLVASGISYGRIDGTVSVERRGELVEMFQAGKLDAMVLSVKAAGVGITLTRSTDVLFVERAWTPADEEQAEDRAHRIGQKGSVTIRYMVATNTMDEDMALLIDLKRTVLEAILNQGKLLPENLDIRQDLLAAVAKRVVKRRGTKKGKATPKGAKRNVHKRA
jgi:SWI/SNF-related matrix-associated actin-dependent regulator 1 of chromatin subfamily A